MYGFLLTTLTRSIGKWLDRCVATKDPFSDRRKDDIPPP
jgi:hypothetical protein